MKKWDKSSEYIEAINRVLKENRNLRSLRYFTDMAFHWYQRIKNGRTGSKVILLGTGIPRELLMAAGIRPLYILGGSLESCAGSEELVPRDTDPVSRSILGYLYSCGIEHFRDKLFLIPTATDSMRKIASQLRRDGMQVFTADIPPVRSDEEALRKWSDQMIQLADTVCAFTHSTLSTRSLYRAVRITTAAGKVLEEFLKIAPEYEEFLNASGRLLIQNSYYYADNLQEWTTRLHRLTQELQQKPVLKITHMAAARAIGKQELYMNGLPSEKSGVFINGISSEKPDVLLMGSPVYFPNDKIPRLLTEAGLCIRQTLDASLVECTGRRWARKCGNKKEMVQQIAKIRYRTDGSAAYIKNEVLRERVRDMIRAGTIEGVIFHILKGQIEQDFELSFLESLFEEAGIPVFRLETDYQYQDVEQLRIRVEAFREMLVQDRYRREMETKEADCVAETANEPDGLELDSRKAEIKILLNRQMLRKIRQEEKQRAV